MAVTKILICEVPDLPNEPSSYVEQEATIKIGDQSYPARVRGGMAWEKEGHELPRELHGSIHATDLAEGPP